MATETSGDSADWLLNLFNQSRAKNIAPEKIPKGGQGTVIGPDIHNNEKTALKMIDYTSTSNVDQVLEQFRREYTNLKALKHPSIVRFIDYLHEVKQNKLWLRMQWASTELQADQSGTTLDLEDVICFHDGKRQRNKSLIPEEFIWHVLFHISAALSLCHHGIDISIKKNVEEIDTQSVLAQLTNTPPMDVKNAAIQNPIIHITTESMTFFVRKTHEAAILHRDIKPANVILNDPAKNKHDEHWKSAVSLQPGELFSVSPIPLLCDFGLSVDLRNAKTMNIGTHGYQAPEIPFYPQRPDSEPAKWEESCDIFSLGATIWHLMMLEQPPASIKYVDHRSALPLHYTQELRDLVMRCYSVDKVTRPKAAEILNACILRGIWKDSCVSPYGTLISPDFDLTLTESWEKCVAELQLQFSESPVFSRPPGKLDDSLKLLQLTGPGKESKIAIFIAGSYPVKRLDHVIVAGEVLQDRIYGAMVESSLDRKRFMPAGALRAMITRSAISQCLITPSPNLIDYVMRKARVLFAIAVSVSHHGDKLQSTMEYLRDRNFTDDHLPFSDPKEFPGWRRYDADAFLYSQWAFLTPVFTNQTFEYDVPSNCILPFVGTQGPSGALGGSGSVSNVILDRNHHRGIFKGQDNIPIACKEMRARDSPYSGDMWKAEVEALQRISRLNDGHLVRAFASVKRDDRLYILFEWADGGNLQDFWNNHKRPPLNEKTVQEVLEQLLGMSVGLATVHGQPQEISLRIPHTTLDSPKIILDAPTKLPKDLDTDIEADSHVNMRHGDLKPTNILVFKRSQSWLGTLKIADFGTAKVHAEATELRVDTTTAKFGTMRYEAPETLNSNVARSRRYDIWSMGCITLEFVVWLLYGSEGLIAFHKSKDQGKRSSFYDHINTEYSDYARVRPQVTAWMAAILDSEPECNQPSGSVLGDLIKIVRDSLLLVEPRERINASELSHKLAEMQQRATEDPNYLFTGRRLASETEISPSARLNALLQKVEDLLAAYQGLEAPGIDAFRIVM